MNTLLNWLITLDQKLFIYINRVFTGSLPDHVFPIWREAQTWYPLYLFLAIFTLVNFGKKAFLWMVFFGLTIAICDQVSSAFIKEWIARPRPCRDPQMAQFTRLLLNRCPSSGSFTSSHAANHFGMAVFIAQTFQTFLGKWKYALYGWAASICYAQVYVGVHYPLDVIGGALLGSLLAFIIATYYRVRFTRLSDLRP